MANPIKSLMRKLTSGSRGNLASFDEPYAVIARLLRQREVTGIIDAGASNGRISRRLLRLFPRAQAYGFEPNPLYTETLREYARQQPRFRPQFLALSDREEKVRLQVTESPGSTSLFMPSDRLKGMYPQESVVRKVEEVEAVTIDGWAKRHGDLPIQLMKFDIQGGELQAMRGAREVLQSSALLVYTEILFNPSYEGGAIYSEIDLLLRQYGFVLFDIFKPKYADNGLLMWANAVFVHAQRLDI